MASYCLDTSGLSNPWVELPEDIYSPLWKQIFDALAGGCFCCNVEIFTEMVAIDGALGECVKDHSDSIVLEIGNGDWNWKVYLEHIERMRSAYGQFISEYNGGRTGKPKGRFRHNGETLSQTPQQSVSGQARSVC